MEASPKTSILINDRNIAERRLVSIAQAVEAPENEKRQKHGLHQIEDSPGRQRPH